MKQKAIIETERLFLREMNMDDFDALYKVLLDSDIMQHYPYTFDEKRVSDWIERNMNRYRENGFGLWAVCLKDTGEKKENTNCCANCLSKCQDLCYF